MIRTPAALLIAGALTALAGCGSDDPTTAGDEGPTIVATTSIWADVAGNVACDGLAEVVTIIPPGGDPHAFEASLRDRETMESASLIVANGLGLEEGLSDMIDSVESNGVPVVRVGDTIDTLAAGEDDRDADSDDDHDAGTEDPHIWFDPVRVTDTLPAIADGLAEAGLDRAALDSCVSIYSDALTSLDDDIRTLLAPLPVERRLLVTNHDSLSYFADRYDFEVLGSVIPSPSSLAGTNPGDLEELADLIDETGVPAIFAETEHSSSDTEALADRVGNVEVVTLQTATLGERGSATGTYVTWLTTTAQTIAEALS